MKTIQKSDVRFVRFRNFMEDMVGEISTDEANSTITVKNPVVVNIDTILDEGRQILSMMEYLPQAVVTIKEVTFKLDEVLLTSTIREDFLEQYIQASEFFYDTAINVNTKRKVEQTGENVFSIFKEDPDSDNIH